MLQYELGLLPSDTWEHAIEHVRRYELSQSIHPLMFISLLSISGEKRFSSAPSDLAVQK